MGELRKSTPASPNCHLVMHGSSSVPQELQDIINKYGGRIKQTWGVPVVEIQRGIKHGVRKINVDTDNRLPITGAIRKVFWETPDKFDLRDYRSPRGTAMKQVCVDRMKAVRPSRTRQQNTIKRLWLLLDSSPLRLCASVVPQRQHPREARRTQRYATRTRPS